MNNKMTNPSQHENTEADFLSRLQSQFGDMDLTNLLHDENGKKTNQSENDSQESSLVEPTQEELESWQNAQFEKGQKVLQQLSQVPHTQTMPVTYLQPTLSTVKALRRTTTVAQHRLSLLSL